MRKPSPRAFLLSSLVLSSICSCADSDLDQSSELGDLRVLAIQADHPEVNPTVDGSFTLVPVVSDLNGAGRSLSYRIEVCADPGVTRGAEVSCEADVSRPAAKTGTFTMSGPYYTGTVTPATVGDFTASVPVTLLEGRSEVDLYNGVSYLVIFTVSSADGAQEEMAYRRIVATTRTALNQNPSLLTLRKEGETTDLSALPALAVDEEFSLFPVLGNADAEDYTALSLLGESVSRTEQLTVSWFAPQGDFTFLRTDSESVNRYQIEEGSTVSPFIFAIVRDDRGGVGILPQVVGQ